jgi:signal transduction histidine kinase
MNALLEGLLDLFRQPTSSVPRHDLRVDAAVLVQAVIDDLPGDSPPVLFTARPAIAACGAMPLRRIVQNLLGNALKHGTDVSVAVQTERVAEGRPQVVIDIDDRGPGLTPEQLAQAGAPFVRWDTPAPAPRATGVDMTRRAGLGLGLHIARALAEREGGTLRLAARAGGGLQARVCVPAAD